MDKMHTILGAGGAIGTPLARELRSTYRRKVRLVGRTPEKVNDDDELVTADLLDSASVHQAVAGSEVAYLCVGLPYSKRLWKRAWPQLMRNAIDACKAHGCKLVFVDNVYMYSPASLPRMTEAAAVAPVSKKGEVRQHVADMLLSEVKRGGLQALIARSADFYGPGIRNSVLLELVYNKLKAGKRAVWQCDATKIHSFTYTPDAARAIALIGDTATAYGRVWHLPTAADELNGSDWVRLFAEQMGVKPNVFVLKRWMLKAIGFIVPLMRELEEMSYQYQYDYVFDSSDIERAFGIKATAPATAVREILESHRASTQKEESV